MGAVFMLVINSIVAMGKIKKPKVQFFIKRVHDGLELWMRDQRGFYIFILPLRFGDDFIVDTKSFSQMKYNEMREVNLMED